MEFASNILQENSTTTIWFLSIIVFTFIIKHANQIILLSSFSKRKLEFLRDTLDKKEVITSQHLPILKEELNVKLFEYTTGIQIEDKQFESILTLYKALRKKGLCNKEIRKIVKYSDINEGRLSFRNIWDVDHIMIVILLSVFVVFCIYVNVLLMPFIVEKELAFYMLVSITGGAILLLAYNLAQIRTLIISKGKLNYLEIK